MPGILSNLFKPGEKEMERKRKSKERKEREQQIKQKAYELGRERAIRKRAYREGAHSAKPLTERIGSAFETIGKIGESMGKEFSYSQPKLKKSKKKRKKTNFVDLFF